MSNTTPNVGDIITWTITLNNAGPDTATNVTVQDQIPAGFAFLSATPSQGTYTNSNGLWTVGTVDTATPRTLQIVAQDTAANPTVNTATITRADQFDPNAGNNSSSAVETPQQADLLVQKSVNNPTPNVGDTVTFTITLNDNGPNSATNVRISDALPAS